MHPPATVGSRAVALKIGDLAKATGTKVQTIRYYEEIGLLPFAGCHSFAARAALVSVSTKCESCWAWPTIAIGPVPRSRRSRASTGRRSSARSPTWQPWMASWRVSSTDADTAPLPSAASLKPCLLPKTAVHYRFSQQRARLARNTSGFLVVAIGHPIAAVQNEKSRCGNQRQNAGW